MNSLFKYVALAACLVLGGASFLRAQATTDRLFETVAKNDGVYGQLRLLANAGILDVSDAAAPLTRYDVAKRIQKARIKYDAIVVAMNAADVPPPPEDDKALPEAGNTSPGESNASVAGNEEVVVPKPKEVSIEEVAATLHTLEEAYSYELKALQDRVQALKDKADELETNQYATRKKLKSLLYAPQIAIHGLGRASAYGEKQYGDAVSGPATVASSGFLDLTPVGIVSKELGWDATLRFYSGFKPDATDAISVRRISVRFDPPWLSMKAGDFEESYTPLMLWNRDAEDLRYEPEVYNRWKTQSLYENYLDQEPAFHFRGFKVGSSVMWPDSNILESVSASTFAHMIRNGLDDTEASTGWYFGPQMFSSWLFAGTAEVKSKKWFLGSKTLQATVDAYGVQARDLLGTDTPGSTYVSDESATWAHRYQVGSLKPDLRFGLDAEHSVGIQGEYAFSRYRDDEMDAAKTVDDFAVLGGPYLKAGDSKLQFNYLNVGPYYYSPLAQTRQSSYVPNSAGTAFNLQYPSYTMSDINRPGSLYGFFNRTWDETFPYGLATPNRKGFGAELDLKALKRDAFKLLGSAYRVEEITSDLVLNPAQDGFVPVDDPLGKIPPPIRQFTYVNVGPSMDFGPMVGFSRKIELGSNARYERTNSSIGTLESLELLGGLRVGVLPFWDVEASFEHRRINGLESGYDGTIFARYPYLYDNQDLGDYSIFQIDESVKRWNLSCDFKVTSHSDIWLDYQFSQDDYRESNHVYRTFYQKLGTQYEVRF
jgi:hypothetical protein